MPEYRLGSIWSISFDPQVGSEIKKRCDPADFQSAKQRASPHVRAPRETRPGLIISDTEFNQSRQKITVLPLTNREKTSNGMARVFVLKSELNSLDKNSEIITIDPATFDKQRFRSFIGILEPDLLELVREKLRIYLNL